MATPGKVRALTAAALRRMPLPPPGQDKEDRGRALVVGGSVQVPGAVRLAAEAALRAGAGKLQVATVRSVAPALALWVPEALVRGLPEGRDGEIARGHAWLDEAVDGCAAALVGPGMRPGAAAAALVRRIAARMPGTLVLDAGALAADLRAPAGQPFVLTPHAGEMAGLVDEDKAQVEADPARFALAWARRSRSVVVLKGVDTWIADPGGALWLHRGGVPGLGTSGSGDTLAGIIVGLAARGADALQAALWGVAVHAQAGRVLAHSVGTLGFLAREIPAQVPRLLDRMGPAPRHARRRTSAQRQM
ncbi:NAD(P)H-hydrate dehydratase [Pseudoxanthomonas sp.]|uniref:NAD(P)H-hydrate dehydratase n=1 Tax=Pseudoxanthomonas sp. TaxID=1871049 RepID=UPI0025870801|nr:NAD(P)H-hydrate dehydratase [Pseudoxanthomonas sp.]MCR6687393.1 NAD(P)H-hydrate dehydratase [Pseudoxanthomonas sp.]